MAGKTSVEYSIHEFTNNFETNKSLAYEKRNLNGVVFDGISTANVERKTKYFNVPVLLRYRFWDYTNVEFDINLRLMSKATDEFQVDFYDKNDLIFKNDVSDNSRRLDAGLMIGTGYNLIQGAVPNPGVHYYFGLVNTIKENPWKSQRSSSIYLYGVIPIGARKTKKIEEQKSGS